MGASSRSTIRRSSHIATDADRPSKPPDVEIGGGSLSHELHLARTRSSGLRLTNFDASDWSQLVFLCRVEVVPIVFISWLTSMQKAVVSLVSASELRVDPVVKISIGHSAWNFLQRELETLQTLENFDFMISLRAKVERFS